MGSSTMNPEKGHPTSPQIRYAQKQAWGKVQGSSSICNWLWPIRRVAPFCTELGSAHRRESLRLQHALIENAFITYPPPIPALVIKTMSSSKCSISQGSHACCNVICHHGSSIFSRTMQVVNVLHAKFKRQNSHRGRERTFFKIPSDHRKGD